MWHIHQRVMVISAAAMTAGVAAAGHVLIGTYSRRGSEGIYSAEFDPAAGRLSVPRPVAAATNASFLARHPSRPVVYAVYELNRYEGRAEGAVAAYAWRADGGLDLLVVRPTEGPVPCHLAVDPRGRWLVVANYADGSVAVFPLDSEGRPGARRQRIQHEGCGPNTRRQQGPHAHGVTFDQRGDWCWIPDLGADAVFGYRVTDAGLKPSATATGRPPSGSGPRHFALHRNGRWAYSVNELTSSVTAYEWDAERGVLTARETVCALPPEFQGVSTAAEISIHPRAEWLYTSNRGHDSISRFRLDASGRPALMGHTATRGRTPRHFGVDASGRWLVVANQDTDNVVVFPLDEGTGALGEPTSEISVPAPVCVLWL
ncbi:MAG: lactonase family protein [Kiritimatiellae bacterium]|nr:lactonase family protein [Kiritimatiellia bacterium]